VRRFGFLIPVMLCTIGAALADPTPVDLSAFSTSAKFSVDKSAMTLSSAVATIEPRLGAPGCSWLRITFYGFPLTADDVAVVANGNIESMEKRWNGMANNPKDYNQSHAVIQLSVDAAFKVWQVDMAVPGHTCTIAPFEQDVKAFLQTYQFDGKKLKLKSKGSYTCDMKFMGIPNQNFGWDIDLNIPVFEKVKQKH
jgi:hypothetical protein